MDKNISMLEMRVLRFRDGKLARARRGSAISLGVLSDSGKRIRREWGRGEKSPTPGAEQDHYDCATRGQRAANRCLWTLWGGHDPLGMGLISGT